MLVKTNRQRLVYIPGIFNYYCATDPFQSLAKPRTLFRKFTFAWNKLPTEYTPIYLYHRFITHEINYAQI